MGALPLLPATVIGSWSFPGWYVKFCEDAGRHPDLYGPDDLAEAVRDAVRLAVDDQLRAGADLIADGEMTRVDFNLGFYDRLRGVTDAPAKVPVPGPFTLAGCIDGGDVYRDRLAVAEALLPIVNHEL